MSPTSPRELAGARQAPFKTRKDSHLIHKPAASSTSLSSSPTNSSVSSSATNNSHPPAPAPRHHHHHPVIIYTHSPKVIHTNARDFMSLVQKLTGLDSSAAAASGATGANASSPRAAPDGASTKESSAVTAQDESSSSSENCTDMHAPAPPPSYMDPQLMLPPPRPLDAHFMPDIPLFAPSPSELFCTSRGFYRYPDAAAFGPAITNMSNVGSSGAFSPSMMEAMRAFPDY